MHFIIPLLTVVFAGCLSGPGFMGQDNSSSQKENGGDAKDVAIEQDADGAIVGKFSATNDGAQNLGASADSGISGANISIPANSLAIDTNITIEEGASLASDAAAQLSGADELGIAASANSVMVSSSTSIDLLQPMTVQISAPDTSGLLETDLPALVVIYKIYRKSEDRWVMGILPRDKLKISDGMVSFPSQYFGIFQAVILKEIPETAVKEIAVGSTVISKKQVTIQQV